MTYLCHAGASFGLHVLDHLIFSNRNWIACCRCNRKPPRP